MVVAEIDAPYVLVELLWRAVPPVAFAYQLRVGEDNPVVDVTDAVAPPGPHCVELVAVGADGKVIVVAETEDVAEHPAVVVAVTV